MQCALAQKTISNGSKTIQNKYVIYVLLLQGNRIYVGKSTPEGLAQRIQDHIDGVGKGAYWTSKHHVVKQLKELYEYDRSPFDEDRKVKEMMYLYGSEMVRGGSYCFSRKLSQDEIKILQMEKRGALDECFKCGASDHFADECNYRDKTLSAIKKLLKTHSQKLNQVKKQGILRQMIPFDEENSIDYKQLAKNIYESSLPQFQQKLERSRQKRNSSIIMENTNQFSRSQVIKYRHRLEKQQKSLNGQKERNQIDQKRDIERIQYKIREE